MLVAAGIFLGLLIAGATVVLSMNLYGLAIKSSERSLRSLSTVLADQADRALQAIELVQQTVVDKTRTDGITDEAEFGRAMSTQAVYDTLRARIAALPQANAIAIIAQDGGLLNFTRYWPIPHLNIADRDYFRLMAADPSISWYLTRPYRNRGDGTSTIYVARRISAPDGSFLGLVLGAVQLGYFERLYAGICPAPDYVFSMFRDDGALLARFPLRPDDIGSRFATAGAQLVARLGALQGVVRTVSPIDGRDRLVSARSLAHFPVRLSVSRTTAAVLQPWIRQTVALGSAALLLEIGLVGMILLGIRQLRAQRTLARAEADRAAAEERARTERLRREEYARFAVALDNMAQGLCMFDGHGHLTVCSSQMPGILGLQQHPPIGSGTLAIMRYLVVSGLLARDEVREALAGLRALLVRRTTARLCRTLANGRTVSFEARPMDGRGWLLTCEDVTERDRAEARIAFLAHHDALTRLPNRTLFADRLAHAIAAAALRGPPCSILCIDLDGFKEVNDAQGHAVGDRLLQEVASRLSGCLDPGETIARLGGDEFAAILAADGTRAASVATCVLDALRIPFDLNGCRVAVSAGIGIACAPQDGGDVETLLRHADVALYCAKAEGSGRFRRFERGMNDALVRRRHVQGELREALERGQFELHYQPLVRLESRSVVGFEALLRWRHPERGLVSPSDFVLLAEESGLIVAIGGWVLATACAEAATWPPALYVAVNLSPLQVHDRALVDAVRGALSASGLPPERLELEITETVLLQDDAGTLDTLTRLKTLGVAIALDDFGTGYSSLGYLRRFPFDKVKIDRSFVQELGRRHEADAIVHAIVGLSAELGMISLAEGVETEEQVALLAAEGCIDAQGYLFSPPMPAAELLPLLTGSAARQLTASSPSAVAREVV